MTVIAATTVRCQTMADGTLRLVLDIDPGSAVAAFGLFGVPGRAVAMAALKSDDSTLTPPTAGDHWGGSPASDARRQSNEVTNVRMRKALATGPFIAKPGHGDKLSPTDAKPKGGPLAKLAGQWCDEPGFAEWLYHNFRIGIRPGELDGDYCRRCVLEICNIADRKDPTRAELDHNPQAAAAFHTLIREPFAEYLKMRGVK